jgi:mRNA-degrading endonuclease toxin of MazEF toxin-antitoxin module
MAEQPRALDSNRIGKGPLTRLSVAEMDALEQALRAGLGLAGGSC